MSNLCSDPSEPLFWQDESPEIRPGLYGLADVFTHMFQQVGEVIGEMGEAITHTFTPQGSGKVVGGLQVHFTVETDGVIKSLQGVQDQLGNYVIATPKKGMKGSIFHSVFYDEMGGEHWVAGLDVPSESVTGSRRQSGGQSRRRGGLQRCPRHGSDLSSGYCRQCSRGQ